MHRLNIILHNLCHITRWNSPTVSVSDGVEFVCSLSVRFLYLIVIISKWFSHLTKFYKFFIFITIVLFNIYIYDMYNTKHKTCRHSSKILPFAAEFRTSPFYFRMTPVQVDTMQFGWFDLKISRCSILSCVYQNKLNECHLTLKLMELGR